MGVSNIRQSESIVEAMMERAMENRLKKALGIVENSPIPIGILKGTLSYAASREFKNPISIVGDHVELTLLTKSGEVAGITLVDLDDIDFLRGYRWSKHSKGYAETRDPQKENTPYLTLHAYIAGTVKGEVVDHINRDKLDNRRSNLRITDPSGNQANRDVPKNNKSGTTGVCFANDKNRWRAYISIKGKGELHLGYYKDKAKAIGVRLTVEKLLWGEFSPNT